MADPTPPDDPEDDLDPPEPDEPDPSEPDDDPDDDPAEPQPDPTDDPDPEPAPRAREREPRRGNPEFGRLRKDNRELRERLARLEQQRPGGNQNAAAQQRQQEEAAREQEVLLRGDPAEIGKFYRDQTVRLVNEQVGPVRFHSADAADRSEFRALCSANPMIDRVAEEVEERLAMARQQGMNPQRAALAKLIIGERVLERAGGARTRQQRRADGERDRQRGRATSTRGDSPSGTPSARRRGGEDTHAARARRLDESGLL